MICHHCKEPIEVGEACIPEAINGSNHFHFFHPGCHSQWKGEKDEETLAHTADLARTVH